MRVNKMVIAASDVTVLPLATFGVKALPLSNAFTNWRSTCQLTLLRTPSNQEKLLDPRRDHDWLYLPLFCSFLAILRVGLQQNSERIKTSRREREWIYWPSFCFFLAILRVTLRENSERMNYFVLTL